MGLVEYKGKIIERFGKRYFEITGKNFEEFFDKNLNKIEETLNKIYSEGDLYLSDYEKVCDKTRQRWVKAEILKDDSQLNKEIKTSKEFYKKTQNESTEDLFRQAYKCENPEEFHREMVECLKEWKKERKCFLEFPYIKSKKITAINPAVRNDIIKYAFNLYEKEDKAIIKVPLIMKDIPEDTTNRGKLWREEDVLSDDNTENRRVFFNKDTKEEVALSIDKRDYLSFFSSSPETELDVEIRTEIIKKIKVFNSLDRELLQYVLQQNKELYSADKIVRDISEIVEAIGRVVNKSNRKAVKESLYKLGATGYSKNGEFVGRFFSVRMFKVDVKKVQKDVAHIFIDGMLREIILRNQTFNFYADKFNILSNDAQKILVDLQSERMLRVLNNNPDLFVVRTFTDFRRVIYFNNKKTIKARITAALDELVKNKMGIKSYELIDKYTARIEFYRFAEKDIKLITGENFEYGDFVDGSY